jgi:hypothetical protein
MKRHHDDPTATDNVHIRVYDAADAPTLQAAREAAPKREYHAHNTTRGSYHKAVIDLLNGGSSDIGVDVLVLGDDDSDTAQIADGAPVGNETFRTSITDPRQDGQTFRTTTFIDSTEANGQSYFEAALVAETDTGDVPINRITLADPLLDPKEQGETVTIDIDITQQDA